MDINNFNLNQIFNPIFIIKPFAIIVIGLYIIFAFVAFNQVRVLNSIVRAGFASKLLEIIAFVNLLAAVSLFIYSLVIL